MNTLSFNEQKFLTVTNNQMQYNIIIVDDNPEFVASLKSLLTDVMGPSIASIQCAYNGVEGVEMIRDNNFDYVFMDINMPYINGIEATRFVRFEFNKPAMQIIAISLNNNSYYKAEMLRAGANQYLPKDEIDADKISEIFSNPPFEK